MADTRVNVIVTTTGQSSLSRLDRELKKSANSTKQLESAVGKLKGALGSLAAFTGVGLGLASIFDQVKQADKASVALKTLGADSSKVKTELTTLRKELNNNVTQLELTQNAFEVMQSGFKDTADVTKILEAATKSAQAKLIDSTTTVRALTSVLNAYGLGANDAAGLSDKFFQTIADGSLTLDQYASVIGQLAPLGKSAGVSIEELNAGLAQITQTGSTAGEAATGLQAILRGIISPSAQATKLAKELGLEFNEQALQAKGLSGVLEEVAEKTGGSAEKITKLFGSVEALQAVLALSNDGFVTYNKNLENQAKAAGKVQKAYDDTSQTITQALKRIEGAFSGLIAEGSEFSEVIVGALDGLSTILEALDTPMGVFVLKVGFVTAGFLALQKAIIAVKATALAGWLVQQAALMNAFGVKTYFAAAGTGALTKALQLARAAFLALPLALVALLVGEVTGAILDAKAAQEEWKKEMGSTETAVEALRAKAAELERKLKGVETASYATATATGYTGGAFATASISAATYAKQLALVNAQLLALTDPFAGATVIKGFDQLPDSGVQEALKLAGVSKPVVPTAGGVSGGGGGGGGAAPQDDTDTAQEMLRRQQQSFDLLRATTDLERELLGIEHEREDSLKRISDFQGITGELREELEANESLLASNRKNEAIMDNVLDKTLAQTAAAMDMLRPLEDQRELLEAKLNGNEEEVRLLQQARDLTRDIAGLNADDVLPILKRNAALQEQVDKAEELKATYKSLASGIAKEFTGAFRSVIDGTKSVNEAFADMLKGIADKFLDMAAKIIQDQLTQQLVKLFGGLFGGGATAAAGGAGGGMFGSVSQIGGGGLAGKVFEGGGYTGDAPRTGGVDGKGGFPAILHPQESVVDHYSDARNALRSPSSSNAAIDGDAMSSYFADSRAAMNNVTNSYTSRSSSTMEAAQLEAVQQSNSSITLSTNVINEVEYATVEEVGRATRAAVKTAEANVYKGMRNMPSKRSRAGIK